MTSASVGRKARSPARTSGPRARSTGVSTGSAFCSELARRPNARYGLQAICEGGGTANAMVVERC